MRTFAKIISSFIFVPVFIIVLITGSIKFRIFDDRFWVKTFEKHHVYSNLRIEVNKYLDDKNANIFSSLTTVENIKDFTDKNISLVIKFLKGESADLTFYIPIKKIPKDMLPRKLGTVKESMTANEIIQKFNIAGIDPALINQFKSSGKIINYAFFVSLLILVLVTFFTYEILIVVVGVLLITQNYFVENLNIHLNKILTIFLNPIIFEISKMWMAIGVILMFFAIIMIAIKKSVKIKKHG